MTWKLTTKTAARVARIDRDRLNEHIAAGRFPCPPATIPGRSRHFDPDDMVALWIFRELMDDGVTAERAGQIACAVGQCARQWPDAPAISYVEDYFEWHGTACRPEDVPAPGEWKSAMFGGTDIRKVTTFRIEKTRALIAHYVEKERAIIGDDD